MGRKRRKKLNFEEEGKFYMYFLKDGRKYSKSLPFLQDKETERINGSIEERIKKMAMGGILTWRRLNGDLDEIFKKQEERFKSKF